MERITTYTSVGGIPYRPYSLTSEQTYEAAAQSPHYVDVGRYTPLRSRWSQERRAQPWKLHNEGLVGWLIDAGMVFIYGQSGNIKSDVRLHVDDHARNDGFHGPWTYYYDNGADFVGFTDLADMVCFRMSVEHYEFVSSVPADLENQISRESSSLL